MIHRQGNRRYRYREHKRNARGHFETRWEDRIGTTPPPWDLMCAEFKKAMLGQSDLLRMYSWSFHTTRWKTRLADGRTAIINYDHKLAQPVTVWLAKDPREMWDAGENGFNIPVTVNA